MNYNNSKQFDFSMLKTIIIGFVIFVVVAITFGSSFLTIDAGNKGVLFRKFGGGIDMEKQYGPGFHVIAPWNTMYVYDVRKQQAEEAMDVLSSNGLSISVDVTVIYRPDELNIAKLHNLIGTEFFNKIVIPEVRSSVRKIIGRYTPEELYSSKREVVQTEIQNETNKILASNYINLDAVLIRSVTLPPTIKTAIEGKLKQEQESLEYEFRLQKETKEAERKSIEAKGIQNFQKIISESISERLLTWKGIEATQDLAKSPNTKIVVVGGGKNGLPLILNTDQ